MKRRISSGFTFVNKIVVSTMWLVFGLKILLISSLVGHGGPSANFFLIWLTGIVIIAFTCVPLKQVELDGNTLVVSNYRKTITIPASEIKAVSETAILSHHPVWITFRNQTEFGTRIMFMPTYQFFCIWSSHPIVKELRQLAENSRREDSQQRPPAYK